MGVRTILKYSTKKSYRLSLEPAYQVIYWSVCSTMFCISFIGILEVQRANLVSIVFALLFILSIYVGMGSNITMHQNSLSLNYLRGIKKEAIAIEDIEEANVYHWGQDFSLHDPSKSFNLYFFNKKNKTFFWQEFQKEYQEIPVHKEKDIIPYIEKTN